MKDLRSGIEHLKQAKAHMSKANGIMSDYISKLKELEEENAGLRAKLEALIQSDDSYMKLPLDADGEAIHIGDAVWYVGSDVDIPKDSPLKVAGFVTMYGASEIFIETQERPTVAIRPKWLTHRQPEPPDSWEQLEEDAKKDACELAGMGGKENCLDCVWGPTKTDADCNEMARREILKRAKKLAGIEEEAER